MVELRVLELFSGIGGMHFACQLVESILPITLGRDKENLVGIGTSMMRVRMRTISLIH